MNTQSVWKLYGEDVKYFILNKVKDISISEDLVQETFLKVHTKLDTLKDENKLKPWVFSIARNTVFDYFKSTNKSVDLKDFHTEAEEEIFKHTEKDCLLSHILNLNEKYRKPLFLSDVKGIKQQDIANQLNVPLPTIKSRIQRARKKVAEGYMDCCGYTLNNKGVLVGEMQPREDCKICR